ncbi:MAG: cytochrome c peroxidase [Desulfobulbus sp.]|jgi:cytochrome c peroxidase|nr:cytochrome c peroxidase [Desulfobulbus sp.]
MKTSSAIIVSLAVLTGMHGPGTVSAQEPAEPTLIELGRKIFFDVNLSVNRTQSCASCHDPGTGFTGPDSALNAAGAVEEGAIPGRFGNRKPPSSAYVGEIVGEDAVLGYDEVARTWFGGLFWDGRATGTVLGDPVAEQAMGPFLNPLEMAMPNARQVVLRVAQAEYARDFEAVWGPGSLDFTRDVEGSYERIVRTIAAYERSPEVNPYSSKFDRFYDRAKAAGKDIKLITTMGLNMAGPGPQNDPRRWTYYRGLGLDDFELKGLAVFNDAQRMGGDCARCHTLTEGPAGYPLLTDFGYYNLGIPKNPDNPFYTMPKKWNPDGVDWIDPGLGGFLKSAGYAQAVYQVEMGKHKTPSLRNIDQRPSPEFIKAFGHNGFFKSLDGMEGIVHFYAWRATMDAGGMGDGGMGGGGMGGGGMGGGGMGGGGMGDGGMAPNPDLFPPPEYAENRDMMKPFNFMMTGDYLVAFLKTLTDGSQP